VSRGSIVGVPDIEEAKADAAVSASLIGRVGSSAFQTIHRKVSRSIHEGARDMARQIARSWEGRVSRRLRKKIEMLLAHLKRILKLDRLRLRGGSRYNRMSKRLGFDADAARQRSKHDPGTRVGASRLSVPRMGFAKAILVRWGGRESSSFSPAW
jgi:hypothetical protein